MLASLHVAPATPSRIVQPTFVAPPAPATQGSFLPTRAIDHWTESTRHGANGIAEGEQVTVGASTFRPLLWGISGYQFHGGIATAHAGVELLVEGDGPVPAADVVAHLRRLIDAAPVRAIAELAQVRVQARNDLEYDRYFEKAYRIPGFHAVASSGPGSSVYFGGKVYADGAFFHELGHVASRLVDGGAWKRAISADDANLRQLLAAGTLTASQLGPVEPDPARRERWTPRLGAGGVTGYAESALQQGTIAEDLAEGLRLRTAERWFGGAMASYHDARTGADRPIGFAELYPNRARLLEAFGPTVAEAAGRDTPRVEGLAAA